MDDLNRELEAQREYINRTLASISSVLKRKNITTIELAALGTFVHNVYTGMENMVKRILKSKGVPMNLSSTSSHKDLIDIVVTNSIITKRTASN